MSKDDKLKAALKRLQNKGVEELMKEDIERLMSFIRPEHMDSGKFNEEVKNTIKKWVDESKRDNYDEYESQVIRNTTGKFYEFQLKVYLTLAR